MAHNPEILLNKLGGNLYGWYVLGQQKYPWKQEKA